MHDLIADTKDAKTFVQRRADAKANLDRNLADAAKAKAAYEAASLAAFEKGGTIPEAPQPERVFREAYSQITANITADENAWLGENAEKFRAVLFEREDDMVAEAAELVAKLDELVDEAGMIRASLAMVHRHDPVANAIGMPASSGTNFALLIDCARNGRRMCQEPFAQARTLMGASR